MTGTPRRQTLHRRGSSALAESVEITPYVSAEDGGVTYIRSQLSPENDVQADDGTIRRFIAATHGNLPLVSHKH